MTADKVDQGYEIEAFNRVTSFVIHDIKNCVASLSLLSRNALKNVDDPAFQRDALRTVAQVVARMKNLLGKLAVPSRADRFEFQLVNLRSVVMVAARVARPASGIRLVKSLHSVVVNADADALRRVFENLITNSVEAIHGDGIITLRTYVEAGRAVAEVSDTGEGMTEDYVRDSLFLPFRSTKPGGWGIGLYEAREIVHKHGGTITIASARNKGTTCRVALPLRSPGDLPRLRPLAQ